MKPIVILTLFVYLSLIYSCKTERKQEQDHTETTETPKALQENKSSEYSLKKRRADTDLVESLYNELVDKTPELHELESQIGRFDNQKEDSLQAFEEFASKNDEYYKSANTYTERIRDSLLKNRIRSILSGSEAQYANKISPTTTLIQQIELKELQLQDMHILLKLVRSLDIMEKYQKDKLPSSSPVRSLLREFEKIISKTDSLSKK